MNTFIRFCCRLPGLHRMPQVIIALSLLIGELAVAQSVQELTRLADAEPDPAKAEAYYSKVLSLKPNEDEVLLSRAIVRGRLGLYQLAIGDASAAIALNDTASRYYGQRAYLLIQQSEYDAAVSDLRKAIRLAPRNANFYSSLSYCLLKQNHLTEAIRLAETGIRLRPDLPYAYRNRGRARLYQGRLTESMADFERSLALKHAEAYRVLTDLGEAFEQKKDYRKAYDYYQRALTQKPGYTEAYVRQNRLIRSGYVVGLRPPVQQGQQSTFTGKRVALLIGNADYPFVDPALGEQPKEDARAMAQKLKQLGFVPSLVCDATADTLRNRLDLFYETAKGADLVVFYFAGHGLQYNGANYLLPVDIELHPGQPEQYIDKLSRQALLVTTVIERLQKCNPRFCLIMLDACREDPLNGKRMAGPANPNRLIPAPFVPIVVENFIQNCCVAQATTAGSRAWNGSGVNGYYTEALLRNLQPGIVLDQLLKRVRGDVMATALKDGKDQRPESLNQMTDDLIF